jgi:hypothetical protein
MSDGNLCPRLSILQIIEYFDLAGGSREYSRVLVRSANSISLTGAGLSQDFSRKMNK